MHPSWTAAPQLEPSPAILAQYADYLAAKIRAYDANVGAAGQDPDLSRQREELGSRINTVNAIREQGALAIAGLTSYRPGPWFTTAGPAFTTLARALLTTLIKVGKNKITVATPLDAGTPLYRTLRHARSEMNSPNSKAASGNSPRNWLNSAPRISRYAPRCLLSPRSGD